VIVGAGCDEVLDLIAKAYLPAGSAALVPIPTYPMYGVLSGQRAARIVAVPRLGGGESFALDLPAVVARLPEVRVVWLCSPNNPTGCEEPEDSIRAVLDAAAALPDPPLVVVDEAYHEFVGSSVLDWPTRPDNLIALRTVSKAFGLAGVRVGWGVANRSVIERLERVRPPGSISTVSAHIATHALRSPGYVNVFVRWMAEEREWLWDRLEEVGWLAWRSAANFVLVRFNDHDAAERATEGLLRAGIVPRTFGPANPLRAHLRLTVRSRSENQRLLEVVRTLAGSAT
jgi:histidinol-phosphate aminotransferase